MQVARVYLDVETTGLDKARHCVVEVGAVAVSAEGAELACYESLAYPGERRLAEADQRAFEVNKISIDDVHAARPIKAVAQDFAEWLRAHMGTLHAFPNEFDRGFLSQDPWQITLGWNECIQKAAQDIMARQRALPLMYGKPKRPRLAEAAEFFGVTIVRAHRALDDAKTTARIHTEILEQRSLEPIVDEAEHLMQDGM